MLVKVGDEANYRSKGAPKGKTPITDSARLLGGLRFFFDKPDLCRGSSRFGL